MKQLSIAKPGFLLAFLLSGVAALHGSVIVDWTTTDEGSADGVNVTATYGEAADGFFTANLTTSDYDPPGGTQTMPQVPQDSSIEWTFDQPVENLLLYLVFWRGADTNTGGPPNSLYTFDQTPTIQSGLAGGSIDGNSFVAANGFNDGILAFPGQITNLQLLAPEDGGGSPNSSTLAFTAIPEPNSYGFLLGAAGLATAIFFRRRRRPSAV